MSETIEIKRRDRKEDVTVEPAEVEIKSVRRLVHTERVEEFGVDIGAEKNHNGGEDLLILFVKDDPTPHTCKITKKNEVDNAELWGALDKIRWKFDYLEMLMVCVSLDFGQPYAVEIPEM